MTLPRRVTLSTEAGSSLWQILGIVFDSITGVSAPSGWPVDTERLVDLEGRLLSWWDPVELETGDAPDREVELHIEDVALVLSGMAYTEVMSAELPWFEMVRWTSDFVTAELRAHWTEAEWAKFGSGGG